MYLCFNNPKGAEDIFIDFKVVQSNTILKIFIDETNATNLQIKIFSINGILLSQKSGELKKGLNIFEIDISDYLSGVYVYSIELNGYKVETGKINLIR